MLRINCKVGMKVITTGDTYSGKARANSQTCDEEEINGYSLIRTIYEHNVLIGDKNHTCSVSFRFKDVQPLELGDDK